MVQLFATVLLCLVTCAVLAHSLPYPDIADPTGVMIDRDHDDSINITVPVIPCSGDYSRMSIQNARMQPLQIFRPFAICVRFDGFFVATILAFNVRNVFLFDPNGNIFSRITLPPGTSPGTGCAFNFRNLFYSAGNKILQFTSDGRYQRVFKQGHSFYRLATQGTNALYASVLNSNQIFMYDPTNDGYENSFRIQSQYALGMAFAFGYLHVTVVEIVRAGGQPVKRLAYPLLRRGLGIETDSKGNTMITDYVDHRVLIYSTAIPINRFPNLIRTIDGFSNPTDVALSFQCSFLMVADEGRNLLYRL